MEAHAVLLRDLTNHPAGHARRQRKGRYVARDHAARADHAAVPDRHPAGHHHIGPQPYVVADGHRPCVAQMRGLSIRTEHLPALAGKQRMHGRDDGHIGAAVHIVPDGHARVILNGQIEVSKKPFADGRMRAVVELHRPLDEAILPHGAHDLPKQRGAGFHIILKGLVVAQTQVVRAQLDIPQFLRTGPKQQALKDAFFLCHPKPPPVCRHCSRREAAIQEGVSRRMGSRVVTVSRKRASCSTTSSVGA